MRFLLLLISIFTFTSLAHAEDTTSYDLTGRWGVGLGLGGSSIAGPSAFKEGVGELDGGFIGSLWGRYHFNSRWGAELSYTRLAFDFAANNPALNDLDPTANLIMINAAYRAWPKEQMHLLAQLGVGMVSGSDFTVTGDNSFTKMALSGRLGGEYMATPDLMLALHLDYYSLKMGDGPADKLNVWAPMLALTYYFSGKSSAAAPMVDSDGDGVSDANDKCPGTLANTNVSADGCALKNTNGDADGDGVLDANDKCPGSPQGEKVTEFGCAKTDKLEITLNVQFATGSAQLDPKATADLDKFGEFLVKYADARAEIEGHTDNTGAEKLNYSISQRRADSVKKYLLKKFKINKTRITSKGYGPSQPIADNAKEEGRMKNRRVMAHVTTEEKAK